MNKIKITIPDNLTPEQEWAAVAKQLGKKMLPASSQKQLGAGYSINQLETQIIISREQVEKPIVTLDCSVCQTIFEKNVGKVLWTNYGGVHKKHYYCSESCRECVIQIAGSGRASIKRFGLKSLLST